MDRGAWRATAHGVTKTRDDRETKHPCVRLLLHQVILTAVCLHVCGRVGESKRQRQRQRDRTMFMLPSHSEH